MPRQPPHILWCELQFTLTSLTNNIMHSLVKTWLPFCFKGHEVLKPNKVQECELKNMRVFRSSKLKGKEKEQMVYLCPICSKDDGLVSPKKKWVSRSFRRQNSQTSRIPACRFFHCLEYDIWPEHQPNATSRCPFKLQLHTIPAHH